MKKILVCDCGDIEHQIVFHFEKDNKYNELIISYHLANYRNIFQRVWVAIKYVFGYKSKYGHFGTLVVSPDDKKLFEEVSDFLNYNTVEGKSINP